MADTKRGRQFGSIRKLSSGRYQARYRGPDGKLRAAPSTFQRIDGGRALAQPQGNRDLEGRVDCPVAGGAGVP